MNPYKDLGVSANATQKEIDKAYKKRRSESHPDKGGSEEEFNAVKKGYELLSDPRQRKYFDQHGEPSPQMNGMTPMAYVIHMASQFIDQMDIEHDDLCSMIGRAVEETHKRLMIDHEKIVEKIRRYKRAAKRIKRREGHNFIADMIGEKISVAEATLKELEKGFQFGDCVIELLEDFEYEVDVKMTQDRFYGTTTSTGTWTS